jgi:hypothetical protein
VATSVATNLGAASPFETHGAAGATDAAATETTGAAGASAGATATTGATGAATGATTADAAGVMGNHLRLQGRAISPVDLECAEQTTEARDASNCAHDVFLRQSFPRLADAWRRLAAACKLSENIERRFKGLNLSRPIWMDLTAKG